MTEAEPDAYVAERVRQALAHDPRVAELGVTVRIVGDTVVLAGDVATPAPKAAAEQVVAAVAPGRQVRNLMTVVALAPVEAEETIP